MTQVRLGCREVVAALDSEQRSGVEREGDACYYLLVVERRACDVLLGLHLVSKS